MPVDPKLLEILACPECKTEVASEGEKLRCVHCGRGYPIEEGIPIMLLEQAEPPPADWQPRDG